MKIMASISGYAGERVTLVALLDPVTLVLAIAKSIKFREAREEGYAFVTNTRSEAYDCLFGEEHWDEAIRAFKVSQGNETMTLSDHTIRWQPRVESDGVDDKGSKYRLPDDMTNGEVAILALVYFQQRQLAITTANNAMDGWTDLITI